jgi:hypothetical protein
MGTYIIEDLYVEKTMLKNILSKIGGDRSLFVVSETNIKLCILRVGKHMNNEGLLFCKFDTVVKQNKMKKLL